MSLRMQYFLLDTLFKVIKSPAPWKSQVWMFNQFSSGSTQLRISVKISNCQSKTINQRLHCEAPIFEVRGEIIKNDVRWDRRRFPTVGDLRPRVVK